MEKILQEILNKITAMDDKINAMGNKINAMDNKINAMDDRINIIEIQVKENTQILKSLEHKTDIIKAEQENMKYDLAETKKSIVSVKIDVEELRKDMNLVEMATSRNWYEITRLKSS